jgi:hypothetical protein
MGDIAGVVVVTSNKEVGKHTLECELLQQKIPLSFTAKQLMDKQSWRDKIVDPVLACWVLSTNFKVVTQILEQFGTRGEKIALQDSC